ncbi:MAG: hypothetical protein SPI12_01855 [Actinomycetaceae bacterium]|nr:hypothetical protein [Actinomycetaceae bacterium]MDY6082593.1 hypothetical protein [Actinomycetaceae bacterium]
MVRVLICQTTTGRLVEEVPVSSWKYDTGLLASDRISLTVPAYTRHARSVDYTSLFTPLKYSIFLLDDDLEPAYCPAAGVITGWTLAQDDDGLEKFTVDATGIEKIFEYRHVRKYPGWPLPVTKKKDKDGKDIVTTPYDLAYKNLDPSAIMGAVVAESLKWPGAGLPLAYPDTALKGTSQATFSALDGRSVKEAIDSLSDSHGIEYDLTPTFNQTTNTAGWTLQAGTAARPLLIPHSDAVLPLGGAYDTTAITTQKTGGETLVSAAVFAGGKTDDTVLVAHAASTAWTDRGYPYTEVWDASHSSVSLQATLDRYASAAVASGGFTVSWEAIVRAGRYPRLRHGDVVVFDAYGSDLMPDGTYQKRVLSVSRDSSSEGWLTIQLVEDVNAEIYS